MKKFDDPKQNCYEEGCPLDVLHTSVLNPVDGVVSEVAIDDIDDTPDQLWVRILRFIVG